MAVIVASDTEVISTQSILTALAFPTAVDVIIWLVDSQEAKLD